MEPKICPILGAGPIGINTDCKGDRCAWYIHGRCSVAVIAEELQSVSADIDTLAESMPEISGELSNISAAVKRLA